MKTKFLTALLLLCMSKAFANRYYVNDLSTAGDVYTSAVGSNSNPGTSALPLATLTYALTLAASNDTVLIDAGTYSDTTLTVSQTNLRIIGAGSSATVFNNNFASANTNYFLKIQASGVKLTGLMAIKYNTVAVGVGRAITVSGATGVQLTDVVLTNNYGSGGGNAALLVNSNSSVTISKGSYSCNPNSGTTNDYGGGIDIVGQNILVNIDSAAISNNGKTAFEGGGVYISGDSTCVINITNCTLNSNNAMNGGAIYSSLLSGLSSSTPGPLLTVRNSCFDSNFSQDLSAFSYGGAATIYTGKAKFVNCSFTSNTGGKGGAISANSLDGIITLTVDSCKFTGNTSSQGNNGYDLYARVAFSHANTVTCRQNTFSSAASSVVNGNSASISIYNSGNPGTTGTAGSVTFLNTTAPTWITATNCVPITGSCICSIPSIISSPPAGTICSGGTFSTNLASSTPGAYTNYSWTSTTVAGITGHATSGTGNILETLTNTTSSPVTVTYTVTPNFNGLCNGGAANYSVVVNPTANASIASPTLLTCATNSVTLTASSTTPGATYAWSGGGTGSTKNVTTPGNYSVTVSDPNGGCSATAFVSVNQNISVPNLSINTPAQLTCTSSSVNLSANSTTPNAAYAWSGGGTTSSKTVTIAGVYSVTVTDPANGCTTSASVSGSQNTITPNVSIATPGTLSCTSTTIALTASSTTNSVNYNWGGGNTTITKAVTSADTYGVTVTDPANGCTASSTVTVSQNIVTPDLSINTPSLLTCTSGSVPLTASSLTPSVTFYWNTGASTNSINVSSAGNYSVTVTDPTNGCTATAVATVNQSAGVPNLSIAPVATLTCNVTSVTITANSTTAGVEYNWGGGNTTSTNTVSSANTYSVTVTDSGNGCTAAASVSVAQNITTPNVSIAQPTTLTCGTTTVNLVASSTTSNANFNWGAGNTSSSISASSSNTYTVTVTDPANGCTASTSVFVSQNITSPNVSIAAPGTLTCSTPTITLSASSTTNPINYNWGAGNTTTTKTVTSANTYSVTVTDPSNGCSASASVAVNQNITTPNVSIQPHDSLTCANTSVTLTSSSTISGLVYSWSNGATSSSTSVTTSGLYSVTVTDAVNGCTSTTGTSVISLDNTLSLSTTVVDAICTSNNGSISVIVNSGSATAYNWNNSENTATISNLVSGIYTVTVTGAGGCTATASATVLSSNTLNISSSSINTTCGNANGSATVSLISGAATGYLWSNGGTGNTISNLVAGSYSVTVTGAGGCSATANVNVNSSSVSPVTITANQTVICSSDSVQLCAPSGYSSYQWNTGATSTCIYTKQAGNYYLTVTDNAGCTVASNHLTINVHPQPPVSISVNGDSLLSYNALTYQWYFNETIINGATSPLLIASQTGYYTVLVSDSTGCTALSIPVLVTITAINEVEKESLNVYPNPIESGNWTLDCGVDLIGSDILIFDNNGRLVYQSEIVKPKSQIELIVDRGIYLMRIKSTRGSVTRKLIKL